MNIKDNVRRPLVAAAMKEIRSSFGSVALLSAVTNILMLTGPLFMMQVYDRVLASRSVPTLVALCVLAVGLYVFLGVLELIRSRILTLIGQRIEEQLGAATFDAVMVLPLHMSKKEAISQPIRDLEAIRQFMGGPGPVAICDMPWLPLYLTLLFLFHPYLGWLAVFGAATLIIITVISEVKLRAPMQTISQLGAARSEYAEAGRRNAEALHAMGMRSAYAKRWRDINNDYLEEHQKSTYATNKFSTISKIFRLALQSAVLALGAWLAIYQLASPGAMIAASILTSRALAPIDQAIGQWRGFINSRQAKHRLQNLLEKLREDKLPMKLPAPQKNYSTTGLTVAAPGTQTVIVQDVSFSLSAGQGVGVIGSSGSGKSTLARALVGIWSPIRGTVRLDGAELTQWNSENLGSSIGYLPQGIELFDGTVAENISRFSLNATPTAIIEAAKLAGVHDLVLSMPDGYDTRVGASGAILSAGQRQRIGLARALYGNPFLIVLDEPNASLDAEGEAALAKAIIAVRQKGSIVIVLAHRPNVLVAVDHVLVMDRGRMVSFGPRDAVLQQTTVKEAAQ